ncbi:MAG TPA: 30S ribosomal protein S14 [Nitrospiraceae bacterium]|nr:30S ribosomal protein S14 [Nitrospiraceae bacterium]
MAKTSMINREVKRAKLVKRYAEKRARLKEIIRKPSGTPAEREAAVAQLQALPRDSAKMRLRNRCAITGRSRGFYRKFGLGRTKLREATMRGDIPGLRKASW